MKSVFAERMSLLGTETAFEVLARAKNLEAQGKDIVHLEIGEPNFETPKNIIDAACFALTKGYTHYTPAPGIPEVRETIAGYIRNHKQVEASFENVVIVPGGKPIMFFSILATVNPDDEVIYPNPGFPIYESVIRFVGAKPVPIPLREEKQFRLDVNELAQLITPKTKMLIINSPGNPTGGVLTHEDVEAIADLVRGKEILVLSDEIYDRIIYGNTHPLSIASLPGMKDWTIILDGFSKTYAMTGWRLGYGVMHQEIADKISQLMVNSNSCTSAFTQMAGKEALTGPQTDVDRMVAEFKRRRDIMVNGLNSIPKVSCLLPEGSFYVFPNFKSFNRNSKEIADYLLNDAGVACLGGTSFGSYGEGYLRFSYANSVENIQKALERIETALGKLK
ncbi:aspartate/tyrosine/aromatic aminotransferase [Desulfosporosinus acidiphilus SJ4]|uniref:Aminotransferase n=1 Tax=Desulfosporosinus acidiphilus (strain DSM 22704 / JCM 16185 / SJ4) TaxID=646529 RepID=I4D2G8_DESAJ|nr:pyridoxal phosphate-dependent aminotransferase [Desulfosporosinus acidiphilus]AFM39992.1 aspartate/tyrosine/aromatic aminotransferase [Desulfosporosinus acidiphilus SJ4]